MYAIGLGAYIYVPKVVIIERVLRFQILATPTNELSYYISKRVLNQFVNAYSKIGV
jgi:hypothetical protein